MKKPTYNKEELEAKLEERIRYMEEDAAAFPKRFHKGNYFVLGLVVIFCLAAVVLGAWI